MQQLIILVHTPQHSGRYVYKMLLNPIKILKY
jgi:hypothetical protein